MKLEDIKPGMVLWNIWQYSIMGRDTGTKSDHFLVLSTSGEIIKKTSSNGPYNVLNCQVKSLDTGKEQNMSFGDDEINKGFLREATDHEIKRIKIEHKSRIEAEVLEHKSKIDLLNLELSELDKNYDAFINDK